ncbi:MAG: hypothetical protein NT034_00455 [Candidatus Magasanikbacteria bacterium]|nr:hypothetical protein [Candidatus Magasanikbacteria bacterium]
MNTKVFLSSRTKMLLLGSVLFLSSMFFGGHANAAFKSWNGAGDGVTFSSGANWTGGVAPTSADSVGITSSSNSISIDTNTTVVDLITGGTFTGSLTLASGVSVTTTGNLALNAGTFNLTNANNTINVGGIFGVSSTVNMSAGTFNLSGDMAATTTFNGGTGGTVNFNGASKTISGAGSVTFATLNINGNTSLSMNVTSTGDITVAASKTFDLGSSNLHTAGAVNNSGTITQSGGTLTMTGSSNLGGSGSTTVYNLVLDGMVSLNGDVTSTNDFTVNGGNFTGQTGTTNYNMHVGGNITIASSMQFGVGYGHLHLTMTGASKNFTFSAGDPSVTEFTVANGGSVTLVGSSRTLTVYSTTTVAGTLNCGDATTFLTYGDGSSALSVSGTLNTNTSTITFNGTNQIIPTSTYYNLIIGPASGGTATFGGDVTSTNLTVSGSAVTLSLGSKNLVVSGNLNVSAGSFTQSSGSVTMTGQGVLGGNSTALPYDLFITGTTTFQGAVTAHSVTINPGARLNASTSSLFFVTGNAPGAVTPLVINGTFNSNSSTVVYSGGTYIASTTYAQLIISGTNMLINGDITVNGDLNGGGSATQSTGTLYMAGNGRTFNVSNSSFYNIDIATTTLASNVTSTNIFTINGTLSPASYTINLTKTGTPFVVNGSFVPGTSKGRYAGAATNITPTTYYNLTLDGTASSTITGSTTVQNTLAISSAILSQPGSDYLTLSGTGTPLSNTSAAFLATTTGRVNVRFNGASVNVPAAVYYNLKIDSASATLIGNVTSTNALIISSGKTLNGGSYTITLDTNTGSVFQNGGTFNADTSNVYYANTAANISGETYYTLTLGSGTYNLSSPATSTNSFVNGGTFNVYYNFISSGDTYTNNGTVTLVNSAVVKRAATAGFTTNSYISGSSNGTGNTITITVTDLASNLLAASAESKTATISATTYSDSESVTLTETGVATGIFSGTIPFNIASGAASNSKVDVSGNGNLTLTYSNGYGALSGSGASAVYTGSNFLSGSTGVGGSVPSVSSDISAATISTGSKTTSQTITLNLSASNAIQVAISEDPSFVGASWESYAPTKSFTLSGGAGTKTVYVKFRSSSGGVSNTFKVTVVLDSSYSPVVVTNPSPVAAATAANFVVSDENSKVVILPVKKLVYAPNSSVAYTYTFKNETDKTLKIKVLRQVVNADGKVVTKVNSTASIGKGKTFKSNAVNSLNSKVTEGNYTVQVKVMDSKGNLLGENSFDLTVKKPTPVVKKPLVKTTVKAPAKKK